MSNAIKKVLSIAVLLVLAMAMIPAALADSGKLKITDVDFDDIAPGETIQLEIDLENTHSDKRIEDITIKATLEDIDGDEVTHTARRAIEYLSSGKELDNINLKLPTGSDLREGNYWIRVSAEGEYEDTNIEVSDERSYEIEIERYSYSLSVIDVRCDSEDIAVTLLNNGEEDLNDITLEVAIPELDYRERVNLLNPLYFGTEHTSYLSLDIPEADEGIYTIEVSAWNDEAEAEYEEDFVIEETREIIADGKKIKLSIDDWMPAVNDVQDQSIKAGKPSVFSIAVQNNQARTKTYEFSLSSINWAESVRMDPEEVTLASGESAYINIHLIPNTEAGERSFVLSVLEDNEVISSARVDVVVEPSLSEFNQMLIYFFAVLIIVLAVMAAGWHWKLNQNGNSRKVEKVYY